MCLATGTVDDAVALLFPEPELSIPDKCEQPKPTAQDLDMSIDGLHSAGAADPFENKLTAEYEGAVTTLCDAEFAVYDDNPPSISNDFVMNCGFPAMVRNPVWTEVHQEGAGEDKQNRAHCSQSAQPYTTTEGCEAPFECCEAAVECFNTNSQTSTVDQQSSSQPNHADNTRDTAAPQSKAAQRKTPDGQKEKKRLVAWTPEEHQRFVFALEKLRTRDTEAVDASGKKTKGLGHGIAQIIALAVGTRTAAQVRSHAQKHFTRQRREQGEC